MSNTSIININNQEVIFENKDEQVFCTSLDVAKVFGKRHDNVLADIKLILNDLREIGTSNDLLNFQEVVRISKTTNPKNGKLVSRKMPIYNLTRDGFSLLAMGFTGKKALRFKIAFINAFNEMERIIKNQYTPKLENYNKYKIPNTPYKENIIKAIMQTEQNRNCEFEELIAYEIKEIYKDNKSHIEQKINFRAKGLI
ncbi:Rha family transcriptional regulator [Campylobacter jejuni]|uniref:Rha family transcriptional regulator n=1 Tax=Campylobacter jejuni TaxID=197 RepID=UPI00069A039F|nr:Rha family transcriptional regulator [Campylobacter jejuni]EAI1329298.1 phage regulatory protein [Campylobacter coli]EAH8754522.1 phage regulatory protein [Campylobacter jejuni]EAI1396761.1 phage regulatory protein [Campylobacter jejuni]EAI3847057.1 phage regulatory protein [Campylobacter jejuni]EAI3848813.1 phage regulatory protein [Campylobacter jejuni]